MAAGCTRTTRWTLCSPHSIESIRGNQRTLAWVEGARLRLKGARCPAQGPGFAWGKWLVPKIVEGGC